MASILPIDSVIFSPTNFQYNQNYIQNLIADGVVFNFFNPAINYQNPIYENVNNFNENIGILQTATNSISQILQYIDMLKQTNPTEENIINDLVNEINSTIQNTTFNSLPVFNQTITLNDQKIDLSLPLLDLNNTTIEEYEKLLAQKEDDIFKALENTSLQLPINENYNPQELENILNTADLLNAFNPDLLSFLNIQDLLND